MRTSFMQLFPHLRPDAGVMETHLPSLRRYAEAMSDNRQAIDACMAAVADITVLPAASSAKVGLFKLYARFHAHACTPEQSARARMRQVLLLVLMEGFSQKQTAEILDVSMAEVVTILKSAGGTMPAFSRTQAVGKGRPSYRPIHISPFEGDKETCRGKARIDRHVH